MNYVNAEKNYDWLKLSTDVIPFLARNQFKDKLYKMMEEATKEKTKKKQFGEINQFKDLTDRIDALFNTDDSVTGDSKKLSINIVGHIDPMDSVNACIRLKNIRAFKSVNLEGQKLVQRFESTKAQYQLDYRLF